MTTIPKKTLPTGVNDLRNISCTMLPSKIYESYVLNWSQEEVKLRDNQYGGVRGCSTSHLLVGVMDEIARGLEDDRAAVLLTSIDYAKAFNRLSFQHCLKAFARLGASTPIIELIATFLSNRTMSVRVGESWSEPRQVNGGVPQGSILGVFLFNATTDDIEGAEAGGSGDEESDCLEVPTSSSEDDQTPSGPTSTPSGGQELLHDDWSPIPGRPGRDSYGLLASESNQRRARAAVRRIAYSSEEEEDVPVETSRKNAKWRGRKPCSFRYVDDNLQLTTMNMELSLIHI